jgi:hypothetical protein
MSKFRYPIFPDRTYTIIYEDFEYEVTGEEIIAMFRRGAYLEDMFKDLDMRSLDTQDHSEETAPGRHGNSE